LHEVKQLNFMDKSLSFETERLSLRVLDIRDKEHCFQYRSLPEICRFQSWKPSGTEEIDAFIERNLLVIPNTPNTWLQLAVCLKDGRLIGDIGIHFLDDGFQAELGYTIAPDFQGRGYAEEAVRAATHFLFSSLMKHRITASVDPDNLKSIKLLEKIGFRKEAHFVKSYRMNDEWCDDCIYALLAEEV